MKCDWEVDEDEADGQPDYWKHWVYSFVETIDHTRLGNLRFYLLFVEAIANGPQRGLGAIWNPYFIEYIAHMGLERVLADE